MNKLEDHIKKTLEGREIMPSNNAWEKIEAEIASKQTRKSNHRKWYGIAASLIGMFAVALYFLTANNNKRVEVVKTPQKDQLELQKIVPIAVEQPFKVVEIQEKAIEEEKKLQALPKNEVFAHSYSVEDSLKVKDPLQEKSTLNDQEALIAMKIEEVFVAVKQMETTTNEVSDKEIDSLLRAAQKEILLANYIQKDTVKMDAMALLMEVEEELDESFRDQLFDKLKQGYFKLRTAVADRNK